MVPEAVSIQIGIGHIVYFCEHFTYLVSKLVTYWTDK